MRRTSWINRKLITRILMRQSSTCSSHGLPVSEAIAVPTSSHVTALTHRSLVRITGTDSSQLLQDLVTVDVSTLQESKALYSMMLNAQGRVLYDIILYHHGDNDCLIECDSQAVANVIKHLKRYALRSKVDVSNADPDYRLWALYPGCLEVTTRKDWHYLDPRLSVFGTRLLTTASNEITDLLSEGNITEVPLDTYHLHRLKTGLAEGTVEIPVGSCFPLEYNLDYLNGVSFSKGCYLGQELTARTHHTGVIRKRIMPVSLSERPDTDIPMGSRVVNDKGKPLGKLITHQHEVGLALLRTKESADNELFLGDTISGKRIGILPHKPSWWPTTTSN